MTSGAACLCHILQSKSDAACEACNVKQLNMLVLCVSYVTCTMSGQAPLPADQNLMACRVC